MKWDASGGVSGIDKCSVSFASVMTMSFRDHSFPMMLPGLGVVVDETILNVLKRFLFKV